MTPNPKPDHYAVLNLAPGASPAEIKSAYRRMANACHPDKNPDDPRAPERFLEIQQAYRVLGDPALRARYDHSLRSGKPEPDLLRRSRSMINSFVENLRAAAGSWPRRGRDVRTPLELDLTDAARGGRFRLDLEGDPLEVSVPAGIEDGTRLKIEGHGDPGTGGGKPGDLIVEMRIRAHPLLARRGADLFCRVPVPFPRAALGGPVVVPTLDGPHEITLPAGTADGRVIRLRGKGMPRSAGGAAGDLLITIGLETPVELTAGMKDLLGRFAEQTGPRHYPEAARYRKVLDSLA